MANISAGYIRELSVLIIMSALINIDADTKVDVPLDKVDTEIANLNKDIRDYLAGLSPEVSIKAYNRVSSLFNRVINVIPKKLSPELLALYVLHANFNERLGVPLEPSLQIFQRDYLSIAEDICDTHLSEIEADVFSSSYDILSIMKG